MIRIPILSIFTRVWQALHNVFMDTTLTMEKFPHNSPHDECFIAAPLLGRPHDNGTELKLELDF